MAPSHVTASRSTAREAQRALGGRPGARRHLALAAGALLALAACSPPPPPQPPSGFEPIAATFDQDTEGWTSTEPASPAWEAPGHLVVVDDGSSWQYAVAPAAFVGDWTGAEAIRFRVMADEGPMQFPLRVVVTGSAHALYVEYPLDALTPGGWVMLSAPFAEGTWRRFVDEDSEGALATQAEIDEAIANVADLRIRLDLNDKFTGDEVNRLDDVVVE